MMTQIPSLTQQQLTLLRVAKKHSVREIRLVYEFPVIDDQEPPNSHPSFIQGLIDAHLIQVQVNSTILSASAFQQTNWTEYSKGIDDPTQEDWDRWRDRFIAQQEEGFDQLMTPGVGFGEFSKVWIREIGLQATQPSNM